MEFTPNKICIPLGLSLFYFSKAKVTVWWYKRGVELAGPNCILPWRSNFYRQQQITGLFQIIVRDSALFTKCLIFLAWGVEVFYLWSQVYCSFYVTYKLASNILGDVKERPVWKQEEKHPYKQIYNSNGFPVLARLVTIYTHMRRNTFAASKTVNKSCLT